VIVLVPAIGLGAAYAHHAWRSFTRTPAAGVVSANPTARLDSLAGSRYPLWKEAFHAWESHPFDGTGAGTWPLWWNQHGTDGEYTLNTHNLWLENLAELGAPGLALIVSVALAALSVALALRRRTRRSASAGAAAAITSALLVYLWSASVDWMWQSTAVTVLALAAVAAGAVRLSSGKWSPPVWLRALLAVAAAAIGAFQIPGIASTQAVRHSQAAAQAGNIGLALSYARDAVSAEPWSASAYEQKALVEESDGLLPQAASDERAAIAREPTNYAHWLIMARIQTERGQLRLALYDYDEAQSLRPLASVFRLAPYFATPGHPYGILP
jgi:tetratricopeptide (TPR) repeat protein